MTFFKMLGGIAFAGGCFVKKQIKKPLNRLWHWMHWKP